MGLNGTGMDLFPATPLSSQKASELFVVVRTPRCCRKIFRQLSRLWSATTPSRLSGPNLSSDIIRLATRRHAHHFSLAASPTHRSMRAVGPLLTTVLHQQLCRPPISLPVTLLLHFGARKCHLFLFLSDDCF